jgi:hypothetical protein
MLPFIPTVCVVTPTLVYLGRRYFLRQKTRADDSVGNSPEDVTSVSKALDFMPSREEVSRKRKTDAEKAYNDFMAETSTIETAFNETMARREKEATVLAEDMKRQSDLFDKVIEQHKKIQKVVLEVSGEPLTSSIFSHSKAVAGSSSAASGDEAAVCVGTKKSRAKKTK